MPRAANLMCLTCEQVLDNGRCTNELCPGYRPDPEEPTMTSEVDSSRDTMERAGHRIDTLEAQLRDLREALTWTTEALSSTANLLEQLLTNVRADATKAAALLGDKEAGT